MAPGNIVLGELAGKETWGLVLVVALLGALGGLAQHVVARDPADATARSWNGVIVGVIAALGALWASSPDTASQQIGQSLVAGFFGRAVLAALQTRITAAVEKDRRERATAVAREALGMLERRMLPPGKGEAALVVGDGEIAVLRTRLAELEPHRHVEERP